MINAFLVFNGQELCVTCSIGVACRERPLVSDTDPLVREADLALYLAKNSGRNRIELALY